ncbi:MAG: hypothetical protein U0441_11455 [Polyangiaceae bacterium]
MRRSVLLGAALVAAACAVGACDPPGAGLDPFPGDGVSGFGPSAAVDVCIGSARAIPGGAASLCVAAGTKPLACTADSDCASPEVCECGRCIVHACDAATVCPADEACRGGRCAKPCIEDVDCGGGGLVCSGGGCTRKCAADTDCHRGEVCGFLGTCESTACGAGVTCAAGQTCEPVAIDGDVREPSVLRVGEEDVLFFELRGEMASSIYRAVARDALHFKADPETPVLAPDADMTRVGAPSAAVASSGTLHLLVQIDDGASLGYATSKDGGRTFTSFSKKALVPRNAWESGAVRSPSVFLVNDAPYVFYEGGAGAGIGLARFTKDQFDPVSSAPSMRPVDLEDALFWRSVKTIGSPCAVVDGDATRVYVTANGIEAGTAVTEAGPVSPLPNDSIGLFATFDLQTFDRYPAGPVLATEGGLFGSLGEREPSLYRTEKGATLYFVATDATGTKTSGLAAASTER